MLAVACYSTAAPGIAIWQAIAMQCGGSAIIKVEYYQGELELFVNNIAPDRFDDDVPQMYNGAVRLLPSFNWYTHVDVMQALLFSKPPCQAYCWISPLNS